jgi:DNA topoisomerase-3
VTDETLRERLKEAKGIGTPATRGEIIGGLKAQEFLAADGKHIVPTERGLVLHDVLQRADPALVDPGVTAQMERLLDDVLVGRQDMISAIDAVCNQASRIIARLTERGASEMIPITLGARAAPTRFPRASSARRSGSSPSKASPRGRIEPSLDPNAGSSPTDRATAKQLRKTGSFAAGAKESHPGRTQAGSNAAVSKLRVNETNPTWGQSTHKATNNGGGGADTPLRIPYGNKETAQALGARYRDGGWYAPAGVSLAAFRQRGWV